MFFYRFHRFKQLCWRYLPYFNWLYFSAFNRVGGYNTLVDKYFYASASNVSEQYAECAYPPSYAMNFFRPIGPGESDLPWTGMLFGITISSIWYWCTDQVGNENIQIPL